MGLKYLNTGERPTQLPNKYLVTTKHPFDVRDSVETFNDLLDVFGTFSYYVYEDMCVKVSDEGCVYQLISRPSAPTSDRGSNIGNQFYEEEDQWYKNKDLWKRLNTEIITTNAALKRAKSNLVNGALIYIANEVTEENDNVVKTGFYYCKSGNSLISVGGEVTTEQFTALSQLVDGKASKDEVTAAVTAAIGDLVGNAPDALDTIYEIAAAIKDNPTVIVTLQDSISKKADKTSVQEISDALNANNTLVTPVLTPNFSAYHADGSAVSNLGDILVENSNIKNPKVEVGYKLKYSATYKWTSASGKRDPKAVGSDSLFSTLTESGKESDPVQSSDYIESTSSVKKITASITTDEVGYKVLNDYLIPATGTIKTSDTATVTFLYKKYYGTTTAKEITEAVVKALTGVKYINDKSATLSNLTTTDGVYYLYAYPERLSKITANGSTVWDKNSAGTGDGTQAFIEKTVTITNAAGKELTYYTYRSTQSGNLANTTLAFS